MSEPKTDNPIQISGAFIKLLQGHRSGECLNDLQTAMQECVVAARETSKPAVLILKVTMTPLSEGEDAFAVGDEIATKLPRAQTRDSVFFADPANNELSRENKRQPNLELRVADGGKAEPEALKTAVAP